MRLKSVYDRLYSEYGRQKWWPADHPFEVMIGAILTQNTAWTNVERALDNLKAANALSADSIINVKHNALAKWLRPSGYFNIKAQRLKDFCTWYVEQGAYKQLKHKHSVALREKLLSVKGIGPETADDILLYAFSRKVFVIDAYTRRIFSRLGKVSAEEKYDVLRLMFEKELSAETVKMYNEYHALIVRHGKEVCKTRPVCGGCCLRTICKRQGVKG